MPKELPSDMLNDSLKESVFKRKNIDAIKKISKDSHFNAREIEALSLIHWKITNEIGPIHRLGFRDIMHAGLDFTENYLVDRIFSAFDKKNYLVITMDSWNLGFSEVLKGTLDEKIKFAYKVYDLMRSNRIRKESVFPMLRGCLIKQQVDEDPDEGVKDLIDLLLKKIDVDRDGKLSEEDFSSTIKEKNQLFLQCMGPVFPSRESINAFLTTFTHRTGFETNENIFMAGRLDDIVGIVYLASNNGYYIDSTFILYRLGRVGFQLCEKRHNSEDRPVSSC